MASEQKGARKKSSRNSSKEIQPPLYRHQDCIPNPKLLQSCERHNVLDVRNNQEINDCRTKLVGEQRTNDLTNKSKQLSSSKVENAEKSKKNLQEIKLTNPQQSNGTTEELSKSRKRRLRKQRLLVSLAPSSSNNLPNSSVESCLQTQNITHPVSRPNSAVAPSSSTSINKVNDLAKPSSKDCRKRLDKSVGSRNKSIKNKSLADNTNQFKTDIIKTLEEKTLNSLLQTLVPLTKTSPKKEKTSLPGFCFPERRLNSSYSKVDQDGVFYFGETKHQLEKLTSEFNKGNTSLAVEKSEETQSTDSNRNCFSAKKLNNLDCVSSLTFSSVDSTQKAAKQSLFDTDIFSSKCKVESNSSIFSVGHSESQRKEIGFKTPVLKDLSQFPIQVLNLGQKTDCAPSTSDKNGSVIFETEIVNTISNTLKSNESPPKRVFDATVVGDTKSCQNNPLPVKENVENTMKPTTEETNKSNKTREEIMLEREAKKAAKLAAKAKHKTLQGNKTDVPDKDTSKLENNSVSQNQKVMKLEKKDNQENGEMPTSAQESVSVQCDKVTSVDKVEPISLNKEKPSIENSGKLSKVISQDSSTKSKAELRAERRAKQEAQRAAKTVKNPPQAQPKEKIALQVKNEQPKVDISAIQTEKKTEAATKTSVQHKHKLFSHLYQDKPSLPSCEVLKVGGLHPAVVRLGVQYASRVVVGSNARCVALLHALKQMVNDYITPSEKEFSRGLEEELGPVTCYLNRCRPLSVSMTNALRHVKRTLTQLPNSIPDSEARRKICDVADTYILEQIDVAGKQICNTVKQKIANGDVILTYGCSSLVYKILVESHQSGTKFKVVVVDALPWREGREMIRRLVEKGLSCTYVLITAASVIMREASKVLLGAHALLANGYVMSRAGSSQVALIAHCYNVPVLVCCETHKFCERVQTDAFVYNELGELHSDKIKDKEKGRILPCLKTLSLAYDVTPPDLVSAVVTEVAVLPCTSVPVILRIKPSESVM